MPATFINGTIPAVDFETITVSSSSIGGTASKLTKVTESQARAVGMDAVYSQVQRIDDALFTVESNPIRVRFDGTAPTSSVGHLFNPGDSFTVSGQGNVAKVAMIRSGAADSTVSVTYFRKG